MADTPIPPEFRELLQGVESLADDLGAVTDHLTDAAKLALTAPAQAGGHLREAADDIARQMHLKEVGEPATGDLGAVIAALTDKRAIPAGIAKQLQALSASPEVYQEMDTVLAAAKSLGKVFTFFHDQYFGRDHFSLIEGQFGETRSFSPTAVAEKDEGFDQFFEAQAPDPSMPPASSREEDEELPPVPERQAPPKETKIREVVRNVEVIRKVKVEVPEYRYVSVPVPRKGAPLWALILVVLLCAGALAAGYALVGLPLKPDPVIGAAPEVEEARTLLQQAGEATEADAARETLGDIGGFTAQHADYEPDFVATERDLSATVAAAEREGELAELQAQADRALQSGEPTMILAARRALSGFAGAVPPLAPQVEPLVRALDEELERLYRTRFSTAFQDAQAEALDEQGQAALRSDDLEAISGAIVACEAFVQAVPRHDATLRLLIRSLANRKNQLKWAAEDAQARTLLEQAREALRATEVETVAAAKVACETFVHQVPRHEETLAPAIQSLRLRIDELLGGLEMEIAVRTLESQAESAMAATDRAVPQAVKETIEQFLESERGQGEEQQARLGPWVQRLAEHAQALREADERRQVEMLQQEARTLLRAEPFSIARGQALIEEIAAFQETALEPNVRRLDPVVRSLEAAIARQRALEAENQRLQALLAEADRLREEARQVLPSTDLDAVQGMIRRLEIFQSEHEEVANRLAPELALLRQREAEVQRFVELQRRWTEILGEARNVRGPGATLNDLQEVIEHLDGFIADVAAVPLAVDLRNQAESLKASLQSAFDARRQVTITLTSPRNQQVFQHRVAAVEGTIDNAAVDSVELDLNGRIQTMPVRNRRFSAEVILTSGMNLIRASANTEPYLGVTECRVRCNAAPTNLWIQLTWDDPEADLDLYVVEPRSREPVYWDRVEGIGRLDRDERGIGDDGTFGPEHYYISEAEGDDFVAGEYRYFVHYYSNEGGRRPVSYNLVVYVDEQPHEVFDGTLERFNPQSARSPRAGDASWAQIGSATLSR